ncbi:tape measure protein, partial [Bifidobacterium olomucense]
MAELAHAYVQIVPSMKGVGRTIQAAFGTAGDKGGAQAGNNFTSGFSAKIGAVAGVAASVFNKVAGIIAGSLNSAIGRADQMNNFPKVMKNLGYSSADAAASIKKISSALDGLPTTSSAMTGMVQQLAPLTSNLDEATDIALAFNNAMLAGGASTIEQENALTQYTQMLSAGKVDMQAWRSVQAAMPGQLNQVAEAMMGAGHNANDLYEAMKDGTYSFDDFNKTVMRLNNQGFAQYASFAQQAKDATQGIGTAFENVRNRVAKAVQKVIEAVGVENIAGAINDFSSQFGKIGDAAAGMVGYVKDWLVQLYGKLQENGALQSFKTAWDNIVGIVKQVANLVIDWLKLIPPDGAAAALKLVADTLNWFVQHGKELAPIIIGIGTAFAAVKGYQALNSGLQTLTTTMQAVTAGAQGVSKGIMLMMDLGGPIAAIKEMATGLSLVKTAQTAWSTATKMATAVQGAFNAVITANPIGALIVAITAVVAALVWFFTQTEVGRQAWQAFMDWLAPIWQSIQAAWSAAWTAISSFIQSNMTTIQAIWDTVWGAISAYFTYVWNG